MNLDEKRNELATNYELAFTNEEIIHAIEKKAFRYYSRGYYI
jgi:hypothetical protein